MNTHTKNTWPSKIMNRVFLACVLAIGLTGCVTLEQLAPSVQTDLMNVGKSHGYEASTLERGRKLYLTECAECHSVEPIDGWSLSEWERLLPDMNEEAEFDHAKSRDVHAYIVTARRLMDEPNFAIQR